MISGNAIGGGGGGGGGGGAGLLPLSGYAYGFWNIT